MRPDVILDLILELSACPSLTVFKSRLNFTVSFHFRATITRPSANASQVRTCHYRDIIIIILLHLFVVYSLKHVSRTFYEDAAL